MAEKNTTQRELTCICCPVGCALTVTIEGDNSVTVTGTVPAKLIKRIE